MSLLPLASASHVDPEFVPAGNHTCADFAAAGEAWLELKVDPPRDGVYVSADGELTVTVDFDEATKTMTWTANLAIVGLVFVKDGSFGNNLYEYDPPARGDQNLTTPGSGDAGQISHVSFCYMLPDEVPTCEDNPDMPECQPTCEDNPDMPECPPTCEEDPDMPICQPTCQDNPDMPECQPTCEDFPDMPECQPTCQDNPDMPVCQPTCEDFPDMPECQATCEDQPDMPECQPPTCEDVPDMPGCDPCPHLDLNAVANDDGTVTVTVRTNASFALLREVAGADPVLVGNFNGTTEYLDSTTEADATYTYLVTVNGVPCSLVEVTAIPDFPTVLGTIAAVGLGTLGYAFARRKQ